MPRTTENSRLLRICLIAALGGLLFGFDFAIFSGTIPFVRPFFQLSEAALGWAASSIYVGCILATLVTGYLSDKFGRKKLLIVSALTFAVSAVMMGWQDDFYHFIFWRIVAGIGIGSASILSPLYIAEISPKESRGKLVSINQLTIVIGILLAYLVSYFLAGYMNNWRWMLSSAAIPAVIFFIGALFLPESPRWLVSKGKREKAELILNKLGGPSMVSEAVQEMESSLLQRKVAVNIFDAKYRTIILIGLTVAIFQQISGANVIFVYAPVIFEKAGMNVENQLFQQVLIGAINLIFTIAAMQFVDKIGRKKLLKWGALSMCLLLLCIAAAFFFNLLDGLYVSILILLFIGVFALTLAPVTWVVISEIFPSRIRGRAMSMATTGLWVACFLVTLLFPIMVDMFEEAVYINFLIFAMICLVYYVFINRYLPETKGKSLEQIENELVPILTNTL